MIILEFIFTLLAAYAGNYIGRYISVNNGTYTKPNPFAFENLNHEVNWVLAIVLMVII
ncbi:hypothetical protein [Vibrio phage TCU_VP02_YC]|uniref:Uncharacterized protein n=2 Tax=Schizotequatrovirus KVP40 TaxID=1914019 RepID=A0A6H0XA26_9CAUD|nr:hypothetical protein pp2_187 [Vibrio phage phi-pp2]QIW91224.1 hypothetical protein COHAPHLL_00388 [Vibrio phage V09]